MSDQLICNGDFCPVCSSSVIPGLDYCYCKSCQGYYPTETGLRMEKEWEERKKKKSMSGKGKGKSDTVQLFTPLPDGGYSHHDFENDY